MTPLSAYNAVTEIPPEMLPKLKERFRELIASGELQILDEDDVEVIRHQHCGWFSRWRKELRFADERPVRHHQSELPRHYLP